MSLSLADRFLTAIRFEHWLRYQFAVFAQNAAAEPIAVLTVPPAEQDRCLAQHPDLAPLMSRLMLQQVSLENTRACIFQFLAEAEGVSPEDDAFGKKLIDLTDDPDFRRELDAFHAWVQDVAEREEREFKEAGGDNSGAGDVPTFSEWEREFRQWAQSNVQPHVHSISPYGQ